MIPEKHEEFRLLKIIRKNTSKSERISPLKMRANFLKFENPRLIVISSSADIVYIFNVNLGVAAQVLGPASKKTKV